MSGWKKGWYAVPHEVTWRDLDAIGHVNNAVYFTYFEWARTKYWLDLTGGRDAHDIQFIVARAECNFRLQLNLAEQLDLCVRIADLRGSSFDFVYEIRRRSDDGLAADGKVTAVYYSWENQMKLTIPDDLRERIRIFQET